MKKSLRFYGSGFVVDPDVNVERDSVALEIVVCKEDVNVFRDLKTNTFFVG